MTQILARLERTFGRFAIERLISYIVGGTAIVYVLAQVRPDFVGLLTLHPYLALRQPWRFVTFLFVPETWSPIWLLFSLYWTWLIGTNLENEWGAFKLNVYYLLGALGTAGAAWITQHAEGSIWLNTSLFFAFATVFPDYEIRVFFVVPIKVKWLGLLTLAPVAYHFLVGDVGTKAAIGVAFVNYFVFFSRTLIALARGRKLQLQQAGRRAAMAAPERDRVQENERKCAICGASQQEGADIRVCSCAKCGGPRELCLAHAKAH